MRTSNRNYELILTAAEGLFERYGYDKTSVEDIAAGIGKSKTAVYYYFPGKQEILQSVLEKEFSTIIEEFRSCTSGEITRDQIFGYLSTRMEMFRKARVYRQFLQIHYLCDNTEMVKMLEAVRRPFNEMEHRYFADFCKACKRNGVFSDRMDADSFADMLIVLLRGYELQFLNSENYPLLEQTYCSALHFLIYHEQNGQI